MERKKRILIFANHYEPGYKAGGALQTLKNIINSLGADYEFYLITRNHDLGDNTPYPLPTAQWVQKKLHKAMYLSDGMFNINVTKRQIQSLQPDVIYLNTFFNWRASIQILLSNYPLHSKIIIAPRGELTGGALHQKSLKKSLYIFIVKQLGIYKNIKFHASSELEAEDIMRHVECKEVRIAPDLVEFSIFSRKENYQKAPGRLRLCFISRISGKKNLHKAIEIIGKLGSSATSIIFDIYGPIEDDTYWRKCTELITKYGLATIVQYKNLLKPEEVKGVFSKYDFFFFPTTGENFGHVIFESLSVGTPLILSNTTFWRISEEEPVYSYIYDSDSENQLINILKQAIELNNEAYQELSENAYKKAVVFSDKRVLIEQMHNIFR